MEHAALRFSFLTLGEVGMTNRKYLAQYIRFSKMATVLSALARAPPLPLAMSQNMSEINVEDLCLGVLPYLKTDIIVLHYRGN